MKQTLADALERRGYTSLTPVQQAVSSSELEGVDMLVSAQTGSGKTVGFGIAIAPTLLAEGDHFGPAAEPLALIIAPTRELAMQVKRELGWLYGEAGARMASCVGGMDMRDERRALERGAHIVVATPGRLRDHIMRGSIDLGQVRAVVLDEADEMLDLGFREDLEFILGEAPEERQTLLFSATVPPAIAKLAQSYQRDAQRIETLTETPQHADITYRAMNVAQRDAENAIINVLRFHEAPNAIVFANTRAMVNRLTTRLSNRGFPVVALSGELSQAERSHALQAMRDGRARVCVATDVAARGIDLPNLDLVVHAELPNNHETLLHRSGRTGRAGRKGVSALIVPPKARSKAHRLLKWAKLEAEWGEAPSAEEVRAEDRVRMLADSDWQVEVTESEAEAVAELVASFSPEQIAAAYLRQYANRHSAPEVLLPADSGDKRKPREAFGPSVWFSIGGGRATGAEPRRLMPMLCREGGLSKEDFGAIRIGAEESFVEIRETSVAGFLDELGPEMVVEDGAPVVRLEKAPDIAKSPRPSFKDKKPHRKGGAPRKGGYEGGSKPDRKPRGKPGHEGGGAPKAAKPKPDGEAWKGRDSKPRKPKGEYEGKPGGKPGKPVGKTGGKPEGKSGKPAGKPGGKFGGKPEGKPAGKPKGPKPPAGKPNSKKNKARRAVASGSRKGGDAVPKRR